MTLSAIVKFCGFVCLFTFITGCADPNEGRQKLTGTVTLKGQPLEQGRIEFSTGSGVSPSTGAGIENGTFTIPASHGLVPGSYRVAIYSSSDDGAAPPADEPPGEPSKVVSKERIPAKYNLNSELKADVTKDGENVFTFTLN